MIEDRANCTLAARCASRALSYSPITGCILDDLMLTITPYSNDREAETLALMMRVIKTEKQRQFDPVHDEDMLDLGNYYDPAKESLLLLALADTSDETRGKLIGTLGLRNEGSVDGQKVKVVMNRTYIEQRSPSQSMDIEYAGDAPTVVKHVKLGNPEQNSQDYDSLFVVNIPGNTIVQYESTVYVCGHSADLLRHAIGTKEDICVPCSRQKFCERIRGDLRQKRTRGRSRE